MRLALLSAMLLLAGAAFAQAPAETPTRLSVIAFDGNGGLTRDLALDPAGIRTVLALRSKYGTPQKSLTDVAPYGDSTYLRKAFGP